MKRNCITVVISKLDFRAKQKVAFVESIVVSSMVRSSLVVLVMVLIIHLHRGCDINPAAVGDKSTIHRCSLARNAAKEGGKIAVVGLNDSDALAGD